MPRGKMSKNDILSRIYKLKNSLYDGQRKDKNGDWHDGYHEALNTLLDILNEYSN
jgi:hypothetical protein